MTLLTAARRARSLVLPVSGLVAIAVVHSLRDSYAVLAAALWGATLIASFRSWGRALNRLLGAWASPDLGLDAAVGLALSMFAGGFLAAAHLVSVVLVVTWTGLGFVADGASSFVRPLAWDLRRLRWPTVPRAYVVWYLALAVLFALVAMQLIESVQLADWDVWDDNMAYRQFARELLDSGTLRESYSYRRIGSYGGQSYVQAMILALTDRDRIHLFDNGIAPALLYFLIVCQRGVASVARRAGTFLALVLLVTLPYSPHNISSELSGVVFVVAIFRIFDEPVERGGPSWARAGVLGLLCAALCTLRQNYMLAAGLFLLLGYGAHLWADWGRGKNGGKTWWKWRTWPARRTAWLLDAAVAFVAFGFFLLPWMVMALRSVGTALYPLMKGYARKDFGYTGAITLTEEARWMVANLFTLKPIHTLGVFFLAAFALPPTRRTRALHVLLLVTMTTFFVMMHFFRGFNDADSINRYYFFVVVSLAFMVTLKAVGGAQRSSFGTAAGALAILAVAVQLLDVKDDLSSRLQGRITALSHLTKKGPGVVPGVLDAQYARLQGSVPRGVPLLVMLDHTYLLDGRRNVVFDYDHPGVMGPPPGIPVGKGPEAWATYMQDRGIRYVAFQIGSSSPEYNRPLWEKRGAETLDATGRNGFYKNQARFDLDAIDTLSTLATTRRSLFNEGDLHVIDLATKS